MSHSYLVRPSKNLTGEALVPGDKSISHRALILSSIAEGTSIITGLLESKDCMNTINILRELGVSINKNNKGEYLVNGKGLHSLQKPSKELNCGNSGTCMRLLTGLLSAQSFNSTLIGDDSLNSRPMGRVKEPLESMGANIMLTSEETSPIKIIKSDRIESIRYSMPINSAQVKSAILFASLYADKKSTIIENNSTRNHTENLFKQYGINITCDKNIIEIIPRKELEAQKISIPGDISSAMFIIVGTLISENSNILIKNVGINDYRIGAVEILKRMGAKIEFRNIKEISNEKIADIYVESSILQGITIPEEYVSKAIDEFPILFIAAANANGKTILSNANELKYKESDRLISMSEGLSKCGIKNSVNDNGIEIIGGLFSGGEIESFYDHRVAMSFAIAGLIAKNDIKINNIDNILTSFPSFYKTMKELGLDIEKIENK
ncbi:MAG: 3-phosphoshikimate 1-carboxyvinyltransferase [Gammaproteobacteria bacterium]|nr:3-phosphoshikimate 1-carboxyvinyltransferase [Gammaproteobacteria bacterium]